MNDNSTNLAAWRDAFAEKLEAALRDERLNADRAREIADEALALAAEEKASGGSSTGNDGSMAATLFLASHFGLPGACAGLLADNQELASAKNDKGQSPAHLAADAETTQALLAGAGDRLSDLLAPDAEGKSPMFFAKSPEQAQALVGAGDKIHATDALGNTPLHGAATALFVGFLLDNKADPFAKNKAGQSPLHTLDGPALKALLDDAAERKEFVKERDLRDAEGFAPVARAALRGDNENVKVLVIDRLAEPRDLLTDNVFEGLDPEQRKSIAGFAVGRHNANLEAEANKQKQAQAQQR